MSLSFNKGDRGVNEVCYWLARVRDFEKVKEHRYLVKIPEDRLEYPGQDK